MKTLCNALITALIASFFCAFSVYGQTPLLNIKVGGWKDPAIWNLNRVPADTDVVILINNIEIDTNAVCKTLVLGKASVNVNPGFTLNVLVDSVIQLNNDDTVLVSLDLLYEQSGDEIDAEPYLNICSYYYDEFHRIKQAHVSTPYYGFTTKYAYKEAADRQPYLVVKKDSCLEADPANCFINIDSTFYWYNNSDGLVIADSLITFNASMNETKHYMQRFEFVNDTVIRFTRSDTALYLVKRDDYLNILEEELISSKDIFPHYKRSLRYERIANPLSVIRINLPLVFEETLVAGEIQPTLLKSGEDFSHTSTSGVSSATTYTYTFLPNKLPQYMILREEDSGVIRKALVLKYNYGRY